MDEIATYGTEHLSSGAIRWAVTRNGVPIYVVRTHKYAEKVARQWAEFQEIMGHESAHATWHAEHGIDRS